MKQVFSKLLSAALMAAMLLSTPALAAEASGFKAVTADGGSGVSSVELTVTGDDLPYLFSATLPAAIPASVSTEGTVTVPSITFESGDHGSITGETSLKILKADLADSNEVKITFPPVTADAGYTLDRWVVSLPGGAAEEIGETIAITGDMTLRAMYTQQQDNKVYLTFSGGDHGSVRDDNGALQSAFTRELSVSGSFNIEFPAVAPSAGWRLLKWVNTSDGSLALDPATGEGSALNDGTNRFHFTAVYEESFVRVTFKAGAGGMLLDPDTNQPVSTLTRDFIPDANGRFQVSFPAAQFSAGKQFDKWVNTRSGTPVDSGLEWVLPNKTMEFTAVFKEKPAVILKINCGPGGSVSSTGDITLPNDGSMVPLPTATPQSGYQFDGWYYADGDGSRIAQTNGDTYAIDYSGGRGTVNTGNNTVTVRIVAKFSPVGKSNSPMAAMEAGEPRFVQTAAPEASAPFELSFPG